MSSRREEQNGSAEAEQLQQYKQLIRQQDARLRDLSDQLQRSDEAAAALKAALEDSRADNSLLKDENTLLRAQVSDCSPEPRLREELNAAREELEKLRKDQDDLLELLADQDLKLKEYKMKLINLGQTVDDDNVVEPEENLT